MECIALADPRKAVWMIKIIAATSMIMDMYAPLVPLQLVPVATWVK
jgi:hypothetical protein